MYLSAKHVEMSNRYLDDDSVRKAAESLGQKLFTHFRSKDGKVSSQVRNLQQITVSATRFADIEDFVKSQMGKNGEEAQAWRAIGEDVLKQLHQLREKAKLISEDEHLRLATRLHLARGWVRAVVGAYLFKKAMDELDRQGPGHD